MQSEAMCLAQAPERSHARVKLYHMTHTPYDTHTHIISHTSHRWTHTHASTSSCSCVWAHTHAWHKGVPVTCGNPRGAAARQPGKAPLRHQRLDEHALK